MRRVAWAMAGAALLPNLPANGFDAAGVDIIGLRLGMSQTEVVRRLEHQGYAVSLAPGVTAPGVTASGVATPSVTAPGVTASGVIATNTRDGRLRAVLSGQGGVIRIEYVFNGRGPNEPATIRDAILTRFGAPDQVGPPIWCRAVSADGRCPGDQAWLTFNPQTLTLVLQGGAGDLP